MRRVTRCLQTTALALLASCAWTARENRPVWNAFETRLVPESDGAFYASLPLTIPLGLGAIVVDTFVAHPIQVVDDAWSDAKDVWRHIDLDEHYYTESALLPLRVASTPVWFVGSFLGRSMFDLPSEEQRAERRLEAEERRRQQTLLWCERIANGEARAGFARLDGELDEELRAAVRHALEGGTASGRLAVYAAARHAEDPALVDWNRALQDPSAVVRYQVIVQVPDAFPVADEVKQKLLTDPDEAVRERARRHFEP